MITTKLMLKDNNPNLFLNEDRILLVRYPAGDCDTIPFPFTNEEDRHNLASALFDEYEFGEITERTVLLPDGTEFNIEDNLRRTNDGHYGKETF